MESSKILNYCRQIIIAFSDLGKFSGLFLNSGFRGRLSVESWPQKVGHKIQNQEQANYNHFPDLEFLMFRILRIYNFHPCSCDLATRWVFLF